jgi:glycosyltransferase involved in cell wall biosynthesis
VPEWHGPRVLTVAQKTPSDLWRIGLPFEALKRAGYVSASYISYRNWGRVIEQRSRGRGIDALSLSRSSWLSEMAPGLIAGLHERDVAVWLDYDDDVFSGVAMDHLFESGQLPTEFARIHGRWMTEQWGVAARMCDGATVTTRVVADALRQVAPNLPIAVVPSAIDLDRWSAAQRGVLRPWSNATTIGWLGTARPSIEHATLAEAWHAVAHARPDVRFVVGRHRSDLPASPLMSAVPADRLLTFEWRPVLEYEQLYVGIDIGCCPLEDVPFNRGKSPIKLFEYAASGAAVVASPTLYESYIKHGVDGYVCRTVDEWIETLLVLVDQNETRRETAARLFERVTRYWSMAVTMHRWPTAWAWMLERFRESRQADGRPVGGMLDLSNALSETAAAASERT